MQNWPFHHVTGLSQVGVWLLVWTEDTSQCMGLVTCRVMSYMHEPGNIACLACSCVAYCSTVCFATATSPASACAGTNAASSRALSDVRDSSGVPLGGARMIPTCCQSREGRMAWTGGTTRSIWQRQTGVATAAECVMCHAQCRAQYHAQRRRVIAQAAECLRFSV